MHAVNFNVGDVLTNVAGKRFVVTDNYDFQTARFGLHTFTSVEEWIAYQQEQMRIAGEKIDKVKPQ